MLHDLFHLLQSDMVFGILNNFPEYSCNEYSCPTLTPFLLTYIDVRTVQLNPDWSLNSNFRRTGQTELNVEITKNHRNRIQNSKLVKSLVRLPYTSINFGNLRAKSPRHFWKSWETQLSRKNWNWFIPLETTSLPNFFISESPFPRDPCRKVAVDIPAW